MSLMDTFLTFLCESLTTTTKSEGAADIKFQLGKDRNGISPLVRSLARSCCCSNFKVDVGDFNANSNELAIVWDWTLKLNFKNMCMGGGS